MTLWLIRHAQPLVAAGVCYGATDIPADAAATHIAAQALAHALPPGTLVISSPLQRCERLAQCLQGLRPDLMLKTEPRLVEMNFGAWEGQHWDAIARDELDSWTTAFETWRCGGGESVQDVMARVTAAWDDTQQRTEPTAWITHAGVIRAASLIAKGVRRVADASQWPKDAPGFGQWWRV
jgi:alpha-ribazole phosphatase